MSLLSTYYLPHQPEFWAIESPQAIYSRANVRIHEKALWNIIPDTNEAIQQAAVLQYAVFRDYLSELFIQCKMPCHPLYRENITVKQLLDFERYLIVHCLITIHHFSKVYRSQPANPGMLTHTDRFALSCCTDAILSERPSSVYPSVHPKDRISEVLQQLRWDVYAKSLEIAHPDRLNIEKHIEQLVFIKEQRSSKVWELKVKDWETLKVSPDHSVKPNNSQQKRVLKDLGVLTALATAGYAAYAASKQSSVAGTIVGAATVGLVAASVHHLNMDNSPEVPELKTSWDPSSITTESILILKGEQEKVGFTWNQVFAIDSVYHDILCQMTYRLSYVKDLQEGIAITSPTLTTDQECALNDQPFRSACLTPIRHTSVSPKDFYLIARLCTQYGSIQTIAHILKFMAVKDSGPVADFE